MLQVRSRCRLPSPSSAAATGWTGRGTRTTANATGAVERGRPGSCPAAAGRAGEPGPVLVRWAARMRVVILPVAVLTVLCAALAVARA